MQAAATKFHQNAVECETVFHGEFDFPNAKGRRARVHFLAAGQKLHDGLAEERRFG